MLCNPRLYTSPLSYCCGLLCRGGNSGSPVWVVWPPQQQQQGSDSKVPGSGAELDWERVQAVGVHSSSLKFPKDS